jgi:hypothetical protein
VCAPVCRPYYRRRRVPQRFLGALEPGTAGRFPNFPGHGGTAGPEEIRSAYDPGEHERPAALKAVHGPGNAFRPNHGIPPAP